jgi:hypothetical protein
MRVTDYRGLYISLLNRFLYLIAKLYIRIAATASASFLGRTLRPYHNLGLSGRNPMSTEYKLLFKCPCKLGLLT